MALPNDKVDLKSCEKVDPPHPCDVQPPCDPEFEGSVCPQHICTEKLKNPAFSGELLRCGSGAYINVKSCAKVDPPHPCDPLPACSTVSAAAKKKKPQCQEPALCMARVKNPDSEKKDFPCK